MAQGEALEQKIARILDEARKATAAIAAKERETENIGGLMDFRMKGWSQDGTFNWLVERSNALGQIEDCMNR